MPPAIDTDQIIPGKSPPDGKFRLLTFLIYIGTQFDPAKSIEKKKKDQTTKAHNKMITTRIRPPRAPAIQHKSQSILSCSSFLPFARATIWASGPAPRFCQASDPHRRVIAFRRTSSACSDWAIEKKPKTLRFVTTVTGFVTPLYSEDE